MTVQVRRIAGGTPGILETIQELWRQILTYSPRLRGVAEQILREAEAARAPDAVRAAAIYAWVQRHMVYVPDHALVEEIRGPLALLATIARDRYAMGDCDCYLALYGALLASIHVPMTIIWATLSGEAEPLEHVFLMLDTSLGRIPADPVGDHPFGWQVPAERILEWREFPMPKSLEDLGVTPEEVGAS